MTEGERKTTLVMGVIFGTLTIALAVWFYVHNVASWYYGALTNNFLKVKGRVNSCKAYTIKQKTSIKTYHATCYFNVINADGANELAEVSVEDYDLKDVDLIQKKVDSVYYKNREVNLLANPKNRSEVIIDYKNLKPIGWLKITLGSVFFAIIWIPCLIMTIVSFKGLMKKQTVKS